MVDSITDAVESAIHRGNQAGLRHFMLQGAIRRVLQDISNHRIPSHHSNGLRTGGSSGRSPSTSCLEPRWLSRPSSSQPPLMSMPPPPLSSTTLAQPWNGGSGYVVTRHGAPSTPNANAPAWASGFAYNFNVVLVPPPPQSGRPWYADVAANHLRRNVVPPGSALDADFTSSSPRGRRLPVF
ncbi:hypothetical protein PVAP13_4NG145902 [Panicum virgatum]|uniref:Uncharacterized protein n=1 Tax=Panicum virgatum TaxID=38727 RepID=A0A8T0TBQ4_PANVG|nr:hypothetical protein PVAP13_4NG145902 [Panicum virgatum]